MPGFFGCFSVENRSKQLLAPSFDNMDKLLRHTDMHVEPIFQDDCLKIGKCYPAHCAESVIYNDEELLLVLDGAIHEVNDSWGPEWFSEVVREYKERGEGFVDVLKGDFNIFVYDKLDKKAAFYSDRFGFRYLYYAVAKDVVVFAPEIKAIAVTSHIDLEENKSARTEFLYYGFVMNNDTIYKNISLLPNASKLIADKQGVAISAYWTPDYLEENVGKRASEYAEEVYPLLEKSVLNRIRNKNIIGVPLTGGKDSRLLLSIVKKHTDNIYAFTFGKKGCLDHKIAKKVAHIVGVKKYDLLELTSEIVVPNFEEAIFLDEGNSFASIVLLECGKRLHGKVDISLNGSFSGAYSMDCAHFTEQEVAREYTYEDKVKNLSRRSFGRYFENWRNVVLTDEAVQEFDEYRYLNIVKGLAAKEKITNKFYQQQDLFLLDNIKRRLQISYGSWRYYIDDTYPFADYDMFDFNLQLPYSFKMNKKVFFEVMKQQIPELSRIKLQRQGVNVYQQRKFYQDTLEDLRYKLIYYLGRLSGGRIVLSDPQWDLPQNQWFISNREIQKYFSDILLDPQTRKRGYFNLLNIEEIIRKSQRGAYNWGLLRKLVSFELWQRKFIDSPISF